MSNKQKYKIIINDEGLEIVDLNDDSPQDIASTIYADEYMENFEIIEDDMHLYLVGEIKDSVIEEYDNIRSVINAMREEDYIDDVKKYDEY
jgi:hypothetical protein